MKEIKCQAKHSATGGCGFCGGYGVLIERDKCPKCEREMWFSVRGTRGMTVYEGKRSYSFNGVEYFHHIVDGNLEWNCADCEDAE